MNKDCKEDHVENCIINVIRNCYEVGLFGDVRPYEGSTLQYVMRLKEEFPERSEKIAEFICCPIIAYEIFCVKH